MLRVTHEGIEMTVLEYAKNRVAYYRSLPPYRHPSLKGAFSYHEEIAFWEGEVKKFTEEAKYDLEIN